MNVPFMQYSSLAAWREEPTVHVGLMSTGFPSIPVACCTTLRLTPGANVQLVGRQHSRRAATGTHCCSGYRRQCQPGRLDQAQAWVSGLRCWLAARPLLLGALAPVACLLTHPMRR